MFWTISSQPKNGLQAWNHLPQLEAVSLRTLPTNPSLRPLKGKFPSKPHSDSHPVPSYSPCSLPTICNILSRASYLHSVRKYHTDLKAWTSCGTRVWQSQDTEVILTSHHQCSWIALFLAVTKMRTNSHLRKGGFLLACSLRDSLPWRGSHGSMLWRQLLTLYPQAGERWMLGSSSPFPFRSAWTPCLGNSLYLELVFPPWVDLSGNALTDTQWCTSPMP